MSVDLPLHVDGGRDAGRAHRQRVGLVVFAVAVDLVRVRKLLQKRAALERNLGAALLLGRDDVAEVLLQEAVEALVLDLARRVLFVDGLLLDHVLFLGRLLADLVGGGRRLRLHYGPRGRARVGGWRLGVGHVQHGAVLQAADPAESVDVAHLLVVEGDFGARGVGVFFFGDLVIFTLYLTSLIDAFREKVIRRRPDGVVNLSKMSFMLFIF